MKTMMSACLIGIAATLLTLFADGNSVPVPVLPAGALVKNMRGGEVDEVMFMSTLYASISGGRVYQSGDHFSDGRANIVLPAYSHGNEVFF